MTHWKCQVMLLHAIALIKTIFSAMKIYGFLPLTTCVEFKSENSGLAKKIMAANLEYFGNYDRGM